MFNIIHHTEIISVFEEFSPLYVMDKSLNVGRVQQII